MICINSINESTKVINSRPSKKSPVVWRRRQAIESGVTFTTYERASLAECKPIIRADGSSDTFNLGKLILSIASALSHDPHSAAYDSYALAQTVEEKLLGVSSTQLTPAVISKTTYTVLKRFNELAAIQYGAKHQLISNVRRRGRPSISEV